MKNSWKSFKQWCHAHPFKFAFFMSASGSVWDVAYDYGVDATIVATLVLSAVFAVICSYDMIRMGLMSLSLAALIAMPAKAQDRQPEVGGVAIGVTVIVIGGVAYYFLTKTCQRLFPKPPSKTNELYSAGTPTDCAASFSYQSPHSCKLPDPSLVGSDPVPTIIEIEIESGAIREIRKSKTATVDYAGFGNVLATHGIRHSERPGDEWYGLNGRPAEGPQVPVAFDSTDNSVVVGRGEVHKLTIERSSDFENWESMVTMSVTDGMKAIVFDDSYEGQMFYRVK